MDWKSLGVFATLLAVFVTMWWQLDRKIEYEISTLDSGISALDSKLERGISALDSKLEREISALDSKLERSPLHQRPGAQDRPAHGPFDKQPDCA